MYSPLFIHPHTLRGVCDDTENGLDRNHPDHSFVRFMKCGMLIRSFALK